MCLPLYDHVLQCCLCWSAGCSQHLPPCILISNGARVGWQAAALAEFRADWSTAVKTYQTAYAQVQKVQVNTVLPLQHWYELTRVAEEVHIKVGWLLQTLHVWKGGWGGGGWVGFIASEGMSRVALAVPICPFLHLIDSPSLAVLVVCSTEQHSTA